MPQLTRNFVNCPTMRYVETAAEFLLESEKRYDVLFSMEVLEYVENPAFFLPTCPELVKGSYPQVT